MTHTSLSWTQSICDECWNEKYPNRIPIKVRLVEEEFCSYCEKKHISGIYLRDDPQTVPYPRVEIEGEIDWQNLKTKGSST